MLLRSIAWQRQLPPQGCLAAASGEGMRKAVFMSGASLNQNTGSKRSSQSLTAPCFSKRKLTSLHLPPAHTPAARGCRLPHGTFSRKLLFLAALAKRALAALHTRGVPSSWSSAQALNVWGRGWSWPSRFPCSFPTVLAWPTHCSSSKSVTKRDRKKAAQGPL